MKFSDPKEFAKSMGSVNSTLTLAACVALLGAEALITGSGGSETLIVFLCGLLLECLSSLRTLVVVIDILELHAPSSDRQVNWVSNVCHVGAGMLWMGLILKTLM